MMKIAHLILLLSTSVYWAKAQQTNLTGQVSIHNSSYYTGQIEYVPNVSVRAPFTGETNTDNEGVFSLIFQGIERGTIISLTVEKEELEVVNEREILHVVLGRKQPLKIFLSKKGELAQRQTELYDVSISVLTEKHDALVASLRAGGKESANTIRALEQQLNQKIEHRYKAEEIIREQLKAAKERLPGMTKRLAEVNLDFASSTYKTAYEAYFRGDIQGALVLLDEENLSGKGNEIITALKRIGTEEQGFELALEIEIGKAWRLYEEYALKANALNLLFDYQEAVNVRRKGVSFLLEIGVKNGFKLAAAFRDLGVSLFELGAYPQARELLILAVEEFAAPNGLQDPLALNTYDWLCKVYLAEGDMEKLGSFFNAFINMIIQEKIKYYGSLHPEIIRTYSLAGRYLIKRGKFEEALATFEKVAAIDEKLQFKNRTQVSSDITSIGEAFFLLGRYNEAGVIFQQLLKADSVILGNAHPQTCIDRNNLATFYLKTKNYKEALRHLTISLTHLRSQLGETHPRALAVQANIGSTYFEMGDLTSAQMMILDVAINEAKLYGNGHPNTANTLSTLGMIYLKQEKYQEAVDELNNCIRINIEHLGPTHYAVATNYKQLAYVYYEMNDRENAVLLFEQALAINLETLGKDHPETIHTQKWLQAAK